METDVFISGAGIAGLTAAAAFGTAGFSVTLVDPAAPVTEAAADGSDLRTTAFLKPAQDLLARAGLWDRLAPHATSLEVMRICADGDPPVTRDFRAADIGQPSFGANLPNWLLRREMVARLAELPTVTFRPGVAASGLLTRTAHAKVRLSDDATVTARLAVAADGRNSFLREAAGIAVTSHDPGQTALSFAVGHDQPHQNISTEVHRSGGPFTLVPLPDHKSRPSSAVVWMERAEEARRLRELPVEDFEAEATARSLHGLGPLTLLTRRDCWPILSRHAARFTARRLALIAEAAHVAPPIGAQGLNMSLADIALLLDLAIAAPDRLGTPAMLDRYNRRRRADTGVRLTGVGLLNAVSKAEHPTLTALRARGVAALHDIAPLRTALMRIGMGQ